MLASRLRRAGSRLDQFRAPILFSLTHLKVDVIPDGEADPGPQCAHVQRGPRSSLRSCGDDIAKKSSNKQTPVIPDGVSRSGTLYRKIPSSPLPLSRVKARLASLGVERIDRT
ncbi:hypothetical protein PbB2_02028 [Candidatus Phycosocius bacilliformis]|uniref:Uncharacterized protein n=1 Tax=Candidatus Phycosocius bacilliformis TaxID=1445552 RepID=A0A2P2EB98_9PROT|nr:hypothetical protein PbB2_02028 [Candidatus Phycosocius bacilliformis]